MLSTSTPQRLALATAALGLLAGCHAVFPYEPAAEADRGVAPRELGLDAAPGEGAPPGGDAATDARSAPDSAGDVGAGDGGTTVLVRGAVADAQLEEDFPDTNDSVGDRVKAKSVAGKQRRALFRFDLPPVPPGAEISFARLRLCVVEQADSAYGAEHAIHRVDTAWAEDAVTWNTQPAVAAAPTATWTVGPPTPGCSFVDVTADVQAWHQGTAPNHGWMVVCNTPDVQEVPYGAREHPDPALQPLLTIAVR